MRSDKLQESLIKILNEKENLQDKRQWYLDFFTNKGYKEYRKGDNYVCLANTEGQPVAAMFYGKTVKPNWHYSFKDIEQLDNYIDKFLSDRQGREQEITKRREQRKITKDHDIKVGDIFYTYWGYDQTNSEFYEVVKVSGSRLYLKELAHETDHSGSSWGQDKIKPIPGKYVSDEIHTASARADGTVTNLDGVSFLDLAKYEGGYVNVTSDGWGH